MRHKSDSDCSTGWDESKREVTRTSITESEKDDIFLRGVIDGYRLGKERIENSLNEKKGRWNIEVKIEEEVEKRMKMIQKTIEAKTKEWEIEMEELRKENRELRERMDKLTDEKEKVIETPEMKVKEEEIETTIAKEKEIQALLRKAKDRAIDALVKKSKENKELREEVREKEEFIEEIREERNEELREERREAQEKMDRLVDQMEDVKRNAIFYRDRERFRVLELIEIIRELKGKSEDEWWREVGKGDERIQRSTRIRTKQKRSWRNAKDSDWRHF